MKNKIWIIVSLLLCLTGCEETKYTEEDIHQYIEGLGVTQYTMSEPEEIIGEDEYTDYVYTVETEDFTFHVMNDYHWGMESTTNHLVNDLSSCAYLSIQNQLPNTNIETVITEDEKMMYVSMHISYTNLDEFEQCIQDFNTLSKSVCSLSEFANARVSFEYQNPIRNVTDYVVDHGDTSAELRQQITEINIDPYVNCVLEYQFLDGIQDCLDRDVDLEEYVYNSQYKIKKEEYYTDVITSPRYYGISYGALYKIFLTEGYDVSGNAEHYTVSANGHSYEISYAFHDYDYGEHTGYYYLCDGQQIPMNAYFYNHFRTKEIQELFGLELVEQMYEK